MFGISFGEFVIIGIVALLVIGPDKLPALARTLGVMIGRFNQYRDSIQSEIRNQLEKSELAPISQEIQSTATSLYQKIEGDLQDVKQSISLNPYSEATPLENVQVPHEGETPPLDDINTDIDSKQLDLFATSTSRHDN